MVAYLLCSVGGVEWCCWAATAATELLSVLSFHQTPGSCCCRGPWGGIILASVSTLALFPSCQHSHLSVSLFLGLVGLLCLFAVLGWGWVVGFGVWL